MTKLMNIQLIIMCIICLFCYSCDNEQLEDTDTKPVSSCEVRFSLAHSLRSTDTEFQTGDEIGVFAVERNPNESRELAEMNNYAHNKQYIFNGSTFEAAQEADKIYFTSGKVLDFYVYYPYRGIVDNPLNLRHEVFTDQADMLYYMKSDLLFTKNTSGINNEVVPLNFEHKMALVELNIKAGNDKEVRGVKMLSPIYISDFNLNLGGITSIFDIHRQDIQMRRWNESNSQSAIYRALVPSQTIKKDELLFVVEMEDGIRNYKALDQVILHPGAKNTFDFALQYKIETFTTGQGYVSDGGIFEYGQNVQLSATPFSGYRFEGWFENGIPVWDYQYYNFNAVNDRKLEARFSDERYYKVVVFTTQGGRVSTSNGDQYRHGEMCIFVAEPYSWWKFIGWFYKDGNQIVFPDPVFELPITSDMYLEARFRYLHPAK